MKTNLFKKTSIGIDIGHAHVKAVQITESRGSLSLDRVATVPLVNPGKFDANEANRLADTLRRQRFAPIPVTVLAPAASFRTSVLELPPSTNAAAVGALAQAEAARVYKQNTGTFELCHWRLPVPPRANRAAPVLSVMLPHAAALAITAPLAECGVEVQAIDAWIFAAVRSCSRMLEQASGLTAFVDVGSSATRILLTIDSTVVSIREVSEAGISKLIQALAEARGVSESEVGLLLSNPENATEADVRQFTQSLIDLIERELHASLSYTAQQFPECAMARVLLMGCGASLPGLADRLTSVFANPVTVVTPQCLLAAAPQAFASRSSTAFTLAIGAARLKEAA